MTQLTVLVDFCLLSVTDYKLRFVYIGKQIMKSVDTRDK